MCREQIFPRVDFQQKYELNSDASSGLVAGTVTQMCQLQVGGFENWDTFVTVLFLCSFSFFLHPSIAMGVLMSKKQQVEKVQKCTAVVSAFQAGLKDRAPTMKPAEGQVEEGEGHTKPDPDERNAEDSVQEENDNSASPSTSQQASAPTRDECKVNQEAWSRLRDGKGVEPEDLDKTHQLTPPAFVRPKREPDDDQPTEVDPYKKEEVINNQSQHLRVAAGLYVVFKQNKNISDDM